MRKPIGASTSATSKVLLKVCDQGTQTWYLVDFGVAVSIVPTGNRRRPAILLVYNLVAANGVPIATMGQGSLT